MSRRAAAPVVALAFGIGLCACGPSKEQLALAQLEKDLAAANAVIDSLNYTVESSNLLIDQLRAQVDSTQEVNEKLLASVQQLSREVREWRELAAEYEHTNERFAVEIARLKEEKQADQRRVARLQQESDSLAAALLEAHASIHRHSDRLRSMETELAQARSQITQLQRATTGVTVLTGTEKQLQQSGHLETTRPLGRSLRKVHRAARPLDPADPGVRVVDIGESLAVEGRVSALVDRYGELKKGQDYKVSQQDGRTTITFVSELLSGADVLVIAGE